MKCTMQTAISIDFVGALGPLLDLHKSFSELSTKNNADSTDK